MSWIREYREAHGLELDEFAREVNKSAELVCTITDQLIHILEIGGVTHPRIANAIAEYCGATAKQRDMIVNEMHKGEYVQERVWFNNAISGAKAVVKVNLQGVVIQTYESVVETARHEQMNEDTIRKRCKHRIKSELSLEVPFTFRYKSEWDAMTREEQLKDIFASTGEIVGV